MSEYPARLSVEEVKKVRAYCKECRKGELICYKQVRYGTEKIIKSRNLWDEIDFVKRMGNQYHHKCDECEHEEVFDILYPHLCSWEGRSEH